jgi:hypothetical protein
MAKLGLGHSTAKRLRSPIEDRGDARMDATIGKQRRAPWA